MKLLFENWRQYLKEEQQPLMGAMVGFEKDYTVSLSLIDLSVVKEELQNSDSIDAFVKKLNSKHLYDKAIAGYIHAGYNPMYSKANPQMGGSGEIVPALTPLDDQLEEVMANNCTMLFWVLQLQMIFI